MKTLVIHPKDKTTEFLNVIHKNYTVFDIENKSKSALRKSIKEHEKIIMLGHGDANGLFSTKQDRYVIDSSFVQLLREKHCVCIWCYASEFVEKYKLRGLFTEMIISEMDEAYLNCIDATEKEINKSNYVFANTISQIENFHSKQSILFAKQIYDLKTDVCEFNRYRIYYR
jgi:hypothetical protein